MKLTEIAARVDCVWTGNGNVEIVRVLGIDEAGPGDLTFVSNPKYASKARTTKASAVIVSPDFPEIPAPSLRHANPYLIFARAIELFYEAPRLAAGNDSAARNAATAMIGERPSSGPFVVIEDNDQIRRNSTTDPYVQLVRGER